MVTSVAPDLDLLYFYATGGKVHHHALPTHWPLLWLAVSAAGLLIAAVAKSRALALGTGFVGGAGLLHLTLDSIAGAVRWGAPFSERAVTLVDVPARHGWWVWSMTGHWTFGVEVALTLAALAIAWHRHRRDGLLGAG